MNEHGALRPRVVMSSLSVCVRSEEGKQTGRNAEAF